MESRGGLAPSDAWNCTPLVPVMFTTQPKFVAGFASQACRLGSTFSEVRPAGIVAEPVPVETSGAAKASTPLSCTPPVNVFHVEAAVQLASMRCRLR